MKSKITKVNNGIEINITELNVLNEEQEKLLEAFQECSEGRCTCPTQEYEKVESLNIVSTGQIIQLSIKSKDNTVIDTKEIEKCLAYTKDKVTNKEQASKE